MPKFNAQGTVSTLFQIGKRAPIIRSLLGLLQARNASNSGFVELQAADPTSDDSLATRRYVLLQAGGVTGTTVVNFGAFPGSTDASLTITGQTAITLSSIVEAWLTPIDTADHSADEHIIDSPEVFAGNIVAGVGFTIYAVIKDQYRKYGQYTVSWRWK